MYNLDRQESQMWRSVIQTRVGRKVKMASTCGGMNERRSMKLDGKNLKLGKYTRWANDLTEDQLHALIWLVGEHCVRSHVGGCFEQPPAGVGHILMAEDLEGAHYNSGMRRKARSYNLILEFYRKPFGLEEAKKRIIEVLKENAN